MSFQFKRAIFLWLAVTLFGVLACDLSTFGVGQTSKPKVTIQAPASGSQFREGDQVSVQSLAVDSIGIVRVELAVDGAIVRADAPPIAQGQTSFSLVQQWKAMAGTHTLSVRAFNSTGGASEPVFISVSVLPAQVVQAPTVPVVLATTTLPPIGTLPTLSPGGSSSSSVSSSVAPTLTRPRPTATLPAPRGVWATGIRVDPKEPKRGQFVNFFVTFLNTTGTPQNYRWRIRIFEPEKKNSFGDTAPINHTIAVGPGELLAEPNWRVTGSGGCLDFIARAFWIDPGTRQETEFLKPDQSGGPAAGFQVCP